MSEYVHVAGSADGSQETTITSGMTVTTDTVLGYPLPSRALPNSCNEFSNAPHVHIALLQAIPPSTTGAQNKYTASFVTMYNQVLCGFTVQSDGTFDNTATGETHDIGQKFAVPDCP